MPSAEHESPVGLARLDPDLAAWMLMNLLEVKVPGHYHARTQATDVRVLVPSTYHADCVVLFCDEADRPLMAAIFEVQRGWDRSKQRVWKLYVAQLEAELDVDVALMVYCPDPALARRYRGFFESDGLCLSLRPLIFTPEDVPLVMDANLARANPSVAVFSAVCHGDDAEVDDMFPALVEALRSVDPNKALLYYDIVLAGLPPAARARWEEFMTTAVEDYRSDLFRRLAAENQDVGEARGEARAVLTVLEGRGVVVPAHVRDRILSCTDLAELDRWLRRAITATTVEDVIRE